jgi:hypothetical protein
MTIRLEHLHAPSWVTTPSGHRASLHGYLEVQEVMRLRQHYEVAAWFRDFELTPGLYPVYYGKYYGVTPVLFCHVPATVVAACLQSLFCGVGYGQDTAGKSAIGSEEDWLIQIDPRAWWMRDKTNAERFASMYDHVTYHPLPSVEHGRD